MADVYEAIDTTDNGRVALKVLPPEFSRDKERAKRFRREGTQSAQLRHPNIVRVYERGSEGDCCYFAMALLPGGDLKQRLKQQMTPEQALEIVRQVALALAAAHEAGLVHRDVKPENILFDADGRPVLTDLGIARDLNSNTIMTKTGMSIGTPHYMSPEQARGRDVDGRSDLYSLGIVLYEMLTGRVPFEANDSVAVVHAHVYEVPDGLPPKLSRYQGLMDRLLAKEPRNRFPNAEACAQAVGKLLDGKDGPPPLPADRKGTTVMPAQAARRKRGLHPLFAILLGVIAALVLAGGAAVYKYGGIDSAWRALGGKSARSFGGGGGGGGGGGYVPSGGGGASTQTPDADAPQTPFAAAVSAEDVAKVRIEAEAAQMEAVTASAEAYCPEDFEAARKEWTKAAGHENAGRLSEAHNAYETARDGFILAKGKAELGADQEKGLADSRRSMEEAKRAADSLGANLWAAAEYEKGEQKRLQAEGTTSSLETVRLYVAARGHYDTAAKTAKRDGREAASSAEAAAAQARRTADADEVRAFAPQLWQTGDEKFTEGGRELQAFNYRAAVDAFTEAQASFESAHADYQQSQGDLAAQARANLTAVERLLSALESNRYARSVSETEQARTRLANARTAIEESRYAQAIDHLQRARSFCTTAEAAASRLETELSGLERRAQNARPSVSADVAGYLGAALDRGDAALNAGATAGSQGNLSLARDKFAEAQRIFQEAGSEASTIEDALDARNEARRRKDAVTSDMRKYCGMYVSEGNDAFSNAERALSSGRFGSALESYRKAKGQFGLAASSLSTMSEAHKEAHDYKNNLAQWTSSDYGKPEYQRGIRNKGGDLKRLLDGALDFLGKAEASMHSEDWPNAWEHYYASYAKFVELEEKIQNMPKSQRPEPIRIPGG